MVAPTAELVLNPPQDEPGRIRASATLITPGLGVADVWIRVPEQHGPSLATNADPFVLATLQRTMVDAERHGVRKLRVRGTVSPSLLDNLEQLQCIWERWTAGPRPGGARYRRLDIEPDDVAETPPPSEPSAAVAAFSGGVDSSFTIYRHTTGHAGRATRNVRAAVLIHGMDIFLHEAGHFRGAADRAHRMLDGLGVELIETSTNLRELSLAWEDEYGFYVGAVLTLLSARFGSGLIASTYPYERLVLPHGSTPLTDPLMGSTAFPIIHDGAEYDRVEKAQLLGDWEAACHFMRFCWEGRDKSRNCGHCLKCISTLLCFRLAGVELNCFDVPVRDEDVHNVISSMDLGGIRREYPELLLERADQLSLDDEWVTWLRQRIDRGREHLVSAQDARSDTGDVQRDVLVPLATRGTRPPLFVVNTVAAEATELQALASRLGPDQPFYVLQPFVPADAAPFSDAIDSIARRCMPAIRTVQPHGPYLLGGWSFGALVAYEVAVRLESAGETVALLSAIDSVGPLWRTRYLANGVFYDPVMHGARVSVDADGLQFGPVFSDPAVADSFTDWLGEPASQHQGVDVSRYVYAVYASRPDLQKAFPLAECADGSAHSGLVGWASVQGPLEMGMQPSLLAASSADAWRELSNVNPRPRSRRRQVIERVLDSVNFAKRRTVEPVAAERRDEVLRIAGESMARYRAGRLTAPVLLIHPDKDADGLPSAPLDRWYGLEVGDLDEQVVLGSPHDMIGEPAVVAVAECLDRAILARLEALGYN